MGRTATPNRSARAEPVGAAFLLGFALSGFLDGILLHQILQWHHLLSALEGDLRFQVVADGWFHVAMYAVAAAGLWRLWRGREGLDAAGAGHSLAAWGLLGFAAWHLVDAVGSHWLLGIHRIRMDAADPLAWDLGWLLVFGGVPAVLGWRLLRRKDGGGGGGVAAGVAALTIALGGWGARAPGSGAYTTVAFGPSVGEVEAVAALARAGGTLVWTSGRGVSVVTRVAPAAVPGLFADGALFVGGSGLPPGCLAWSA